jgi:hypothetical protein
MDTSISSAGGAADPVAEGLDPAPAAPAARVDHVDPPPPDRGKQRRLEARLFSSVIFGAVPFAFAFIDEAPFMVVSRRPRPSMCPTASFEGPPDGGGLFAIKVRVGSTENR